MTAGLQIDACSAQHIGDRREQQDRLAIMQHPKNKRVIMAVVADGMGGHTGGALAAEQVVHTSRMSLEGYSPSRDRSHLVLAGILNEAHTLIRASRFLNEKDPHSTGVMMFLEPLEAPAADPGGKPEPITAMRASWAHCGDSRLYYFRGDKLRQRTTDHSYVEYLLAEGKITPEQALHHPNRNVLVTALGGRDAPKVDFGEARDVQAGDSFVLGSDGFWAYFSDEEMGGVVSAFSAREACEKFTERARARAAGEGDNLSMVVLKVVAAPEKPKLPPAPPPLSAYRGNTR